MSLTKQALQVIQVFQVYPSNPSKMSRFTSTAPEFIPSGVRTPSPTDMFEPVKKVKKQAKKSGELWSPPKGWLKFYRCTACRVVMSRKEPSKCPQRINACGHITCAKCIVTSYLVELNPNCPVEGCGKCVNPKQKEPVAPVHILSSTPEETSVETSSETYDDDLFDDHIPSYEEYDYQPIEKIHYCGDLECEWDCGVLVCGCIDQCRGRCGSREYLRGW